MNINKLIELRKNASIKQKELAELIGVSAQAYSNYENGIRQLDADSLFKISKFFNVQMDYFFDNNVKNIKMTESLLTNNEKRLLQIYNNLIPPLQEYALETLENLDKKSNTSREKMYK